MKLVFTKTLLNNVYTVNMSITEVDEVDTSLFEDFGEPTINIGGEIKALEVVLATLPANFRKIVSQTPVVQRFADKDYEGKAKVVAEAWITAIDKRVNTVMTELRLKNDDFTGTQESII